MVDIKPQNFVSYSANYEDVILSRLFAGRQSGFYVDVGAGHPIFENDTKVLHDKGWTGINIEPNPGSFADLVRERPLDRNFQLAVSDEAGTLDYWEVTGTGLSTCDAAEAESAREKGFEVRHHSVRAASLAEILDEAGAGSIDLLKVDVEGLELRVLQGNDWSRFRPSVVVVEATFPETPTRRPDRIRPFLEQHGYDFAYFDGLNDFFVDRLFSVPDGAFRPINVFDRVIPFPLATLRDHAANLEHAQLAHEEYVGSLLARVAQLEREAEASARLRPAMLALQLRGGRDREEASQANRTALLTGERLLGLRRELDRAVMLDRRNSAERDHAVARGQTAEDARERAVSDWHKAEAERERAVAECRTAIAERQEAQLEAARRSDELRQVRQRLSAMQTSTSWRFSRPIRVLGRLLGRR